MSVQKDRSLNRLTTLNVRYLAQKLRGNRNLGNDHHPFLCLPTDHFQINTEYKQKRKYISVKGYQKDIEEMKMVSSLLFASRSFPAKFGLTKRLALKLRAKLKFLSNCQDSEKNVFSQS